MELSLHVPQTPADFGATSSLLSIPVILTPPTTTAASSYAAASVHSVNHDSPSLRVAKRANSVSSLNDRTEIDTLSNSYPYESRISRTWTLNDRTACQLNPIFDSVPPPTQFSFSSNSSRKRPRMHDYDETDSQACLIRPPTATTEPLVNGGTLPKGNHASTWIAAVEDDRNQFLNIQQDKIIYIGRSSHSYDVGVIRAKEPMSPKRGVGYFEVKIIAGRSISVGLTGADWTSNRHPGIEPGSYGYFAEGGSKYCSGRAESYAEKYGAQDIIGCGFNFDRNAIFWTKNGKHLGDAYTDVKETVLYPSVGLHSSGATVSVNFGHLPFEFDIKGYIKTEKERQFAEIDDVDMSKANTISIIKDYLLHSGFAETFNEFDKATVNHEIDQDDSKLLLASLPFRSQVRSSILAGDLKTARTLIFKHYPFILDSSNTSPHYQTVRLLLACQEFVELCRSRAEGEKAEILDGMMELDEVDEKAIMFLRTELSPLRAAVEYSRFGRTLIKDVASLVAYENPFDSPCSNLFDILNREYVADVTNSALLVASNHPSFCLSKLDIITRQLLHTRAVARSGVDASSDTCLELEDILPKGLD
ncbi:hypothetical protein HDV05_000043 [Chytridiales sp. JEL 0842]|nr:hypothetical protein HDV05_000043 [Chytridiales sp. JEL 0842]